MIEKVIETYKKLNDNLLKRKKTPTNNSKTRHDIAVYLETKLQNCDITCDETNNSPMIIDGCIAVARVSWINYGMNYSYVDLIFGTPEQIELTNDKLDLSLRCNPMTT